MTMTIQEPDHDFAGMFGPAPGEREMAALYAGLAARAEEEGLLDVAYRYLDTPAGTLLLAGTATGLVRLAYESQGLDTVLDEAARQLEEYFGGHRTRFDLPLDLRLSGGFRRLVLAYLPAIAYGQTASYRTVAAAVHNPKAVRAVGTACATNPLPLVIPCHRVVRANGESGPYVGGPEIRHLLLNLEAS
jgi:methylated-DNA-[protein]-cysteine S-methyltransferase